MAPARLLHLDSPGQLFAVLKPAGNEYAWYNQSIMNAHLAGWQMRDVLLSSYGSGINSKYYKVLFQMKLTARQQL